MNRRPLPASTSEPSPDSVAGGGTASTGPLVVVWRVTEACHLGCRFCGYARDLPRPRRHADPALVLAFGQTLADFAQATGRGVLVSWLGGEPLGWPPLRSVDRVFRQVYGLSLSVTTNADPLASPGMAEHVSGHYAAVTVSVDGLEAFHDWARASPGSFGRARANLARLGPGVTRRANTILMRGNVESFGELCLELAGWGVREVTFNQLGGNDRPEFYPENRLTAEHVARFRAELPAVRERVAPLGLAVAGGGRYLDRLAATAEGRALPVADCGPGEHFLFVDELGTVAPCSFTPAAYGVSIAELKRWRDIAELPTRFREIRRRRESPVCADCHGTQASAKFDAS